MRLHMLPLERQIQALDWLKIVQNSQLRKVKPMPWPPGAPEDRA